MGVGLPLGVSASADAARPPMLSRSRRLGRTHARPPCRRSAYPPRGALAPAANCGGVVSARPAARYCVRRFAPEAWAQGPCARRSLSLAAIGSKGHLRYAARRGCGPALYAYGRAHRARDPCARRPSPSPAHKGRGHGRRGPRPLSPKGDSGPPPASASAPPPHGGHPAARPPHVGARSAGRAHCARILPPPMRFGCAACRGFLPAPPPPLARWAEGGARSRPPAGGDGGCSHPPASFFWVAPTPSLSDALGIQGKVGFCASVHFPS